MVLGERKVRPAVMNQELAQSVLAAQSDKSFKTIAGGTMCTDDFFEGERKRVGERERRRMEKGREGGGDGRREGGRGRNEGGRVRKGKHPQILLTLQCPRGIPGALHVYTCSWSSIYMYLSIIHVHDFYFMREVWCSALSPQKKKE